MKALLNLNLLLLATIVIGFSSCSKSKDATPTLKPVPVTVDNKGISLDLDDSWDFATGWKPRIESGVRGVIIAEFYQPNILLQYSFIHIRIGDDTATNNGSIRKYRNTLGASNYKTGTLTLSGKKFTYEQIQVPGGGATFLHFSLQGTPTLNTKGTYIYCTIRNSADVPKFETILQSFKYIGTPLGL